VNIVDSLLSFSKPSHFELVKVNIPHLIEEVILLLDHKLKEKNIIYSKKYSCGTVLCTCDENRMKQLFINILMNSIEALQWNGEISIEVRENEAKGSVSIIFEDNGPGIPEEVRKNIFDPFFSTKANKRNSGLGLSICQNIVELHKGTIDCESKPGKYTRFIIDIPRGTYVQ
jgi:signal transduction histidine kinase